MKQGLLSSILPFFAIPGAFPLGEELYKRSRVAKIIAEMNKPINKHKDDTIKKSHGLKSFSYGESVVWAINKKNADRKARKLNLA